MKLIPKVSMLLTLIVVFVTFMGSTFFLTSSAAALEAPSTRVIATDNSDAKAAVCSGINGTAGCTNTSSTINGVLKLVINILSFIVGVIAIIYIIIGGLKYITSQGESSNTAAAKNTILYALIGLVIVGLAQFIVRFTLNKTNSAVNCPAGQALLAGGGCK